MTYETITQKGYQGWEAQSEAVLEETSKGTRILKLRTSKIQGGLSAFASVCVRSGNGTFRTETTRIFEDFVKSNIAPTRVKRVTERAVSEVHQLALLQMDNIIAEAKAFYEAKEQRQA